jgi:type VI secretion system protein ImpG
MDSILPYFENELSMFRESSQEFGRKYPRIAGDLLGWGETGCDPHTRMLVQSFALMAARIEKRLDDDYPKFTESLLESIYPHYLRPFPSCSIVCLKACGVLAGGAGSDKPIPRGTTLRSAPVRGVRCQFQTTSAVAPVAISLDRVQFSSFIGAPPAIRLPARAGAEICVAMSVNSLEELRKPGCSTVRIYLDGEPSFCAALRDTLFMRVCGAFVEVEGTWLALERLPIRSVGFAEDEALIPFPARSHVAYRLLTEYFVFPEKFNFIDIDLSELLALLPASCRAFSLRLAVKNAAADSSVARALSTLSAKNFVLQCAPIINLFRKPGVPVQIDRKKPDYPLLADGPHPEAYEIHSLESAHLLKESAKADGLAELKPFYGRHHGQGEDHHARYWITRRDGGMERRAPGHELRIALVDSELDTLAIDPQTLTVELLCSNRDLPTGLSHGAGDGDLSVGLGSAAAMARMLRKPSPSYRFASGDGAHWRLISHLSLNHRSLSEVGLEEFRQMLTLYDLPRSAVTQRQIQGVCALRYKVIMAWVPGETCSALMPGIEIRLTIDEDAFVGGGIHLFAEVIDHFLGLYCQINVFSQLLVLSKKTGEELLRCPPRTVMTTLA